MKLREVYKRALALINERNSEGSYQADVGDLEKNAPDVVNTLISLYKTTDSLLKNERIRDSVEINTVKSLDSDIPLHPHISSSVLPFALAAMMILEEDAVRSQYFLKLAHDAEARLISAYATAKSTSVRNVY